MIENLLILDTETTGLKPEKGDKVIEIAAILYNVKHKTILQNFSTLFPCDVNPVEDINGIKPEATRQSIPLEFVYPHLKWMAQSAQALVAHNAEFDRKFIKTLSFWSDIMHMPWICTKNDFKWPVTLYRNRLQDVCEAMGVPYVDAHRALNDCRLITECFNKVGDLELRLQAAMAAGQRTTGYGYSKNDYI